MDGYAPAYVAHNVPLLVVSGLGPSPQSDTKVGSAGVRIASEVPVVETEDALTLLSYFEERDAARLAWNGREYSGRNKFKIKTIGRVVKPAQRIVFLSD